MNTEKVKIDLEAANPLESASVMEAEPQEVESPEVVFVPFMDFELRVNQTTKQLRKGKPVKLTRDEARIAIEANKGYLKD